VTAAARNYISQRVTACIVVLRLSIARVRQVAVDGVGQRCDRIGIIRSAHVSYRYRKGDRSAVRIEVVRGGGLVHFNSRWNVVEVIGDRAGRSLTNTQRDLTAALRTLSTASPGASRVACRPGFNQRIRTSLEARTAAGRSLAAD